MKMLFRWIRRGDGVLYDFWRAVVASGTVRPAAYPGSLVASFLGSEKSFMFGFYPFSRDGIGQL